jgi:excisionase family DNA binding protein
MAGMLEIFDGEIRQQLQGKLICGSKVKYPNGTVMAKYEFLSLRQVLELILMKVYRLTQERSNLDRRESKMSKRTAEELKPMAYSINDTAKISGLCRATIYNHINSGKLRSVKVGGRRLVPDEALRELLQVGQ